MARRLYDISCHCTCGEPIVERYIVNKIDVDVGLTFDGICLQCDTEGEKYLVSDIKTRRLISGKDTVKWIKDFKKKSSNKIDVLEDAIEYKQGKPRFREATEIMFLEFVVSPQSQNESDWLTVNQISEKFDVSLSTVKSHKRRGKFGRYQSTGFARTRDGIFQLHKSAAKEMYEKQLTATP